jgi:hypothetical protein
MHNIKLLEPVDYLVIGHITCDLTPGGKRVGGTASFAALTARALGLRVGIVTSASPDLSIEILDGIQVLNLAADICTTFENIYTPHGRVQVIHGVANNLDYHMVPDVWRNAPMVHLAPVAQEVEPGLVRHFPSSLVGLTPQGWLRGWKEDGRVFFSEWPESAFTLQQAGAAVLSVEDVQGDEERIEEMAASSKVLVVTEASQGARVYWNGDVRRFRPPVVVEVDATGAGDVFSAAFFMRLYTTRDPWEAARFANFLAACSVTRSGLDSIPRQSEVHESMVEVL